jgi:hypothetical protein
MPFKNTRSSSERAAIHWVFHATKASHVFNPSTFAGASSRMRLNSYISTRFERILALIFFDE